MIYAAFFLFLINFIIFVTFFLSNNKEKQKYISKNQVIWKPENNEKKDTQKPKIDIAEKVEVEYSDNQEYNMKKEEKDIKIKIYNSNIEVHNRLI